MKPEKIEGATRNLVKPRNWDDSVGVCGALYIRDDKVAGALPTMTSSWRPSETELERLKAGAAIELTICGTSHPPVAVYVP